MTRPALALLLTSAAAVPALAALAPEYYAEARATAPDVFVVRTTAVRPPLTGWGTCQVEGRILDVERGTAYHVNQQVRIGVLCMKPDGRPPDGADVYHPAEQLKPDVRVRFYMKDGAPFRDQIEVLPG